MKCSFLDDVYTSTCYRENIKIILKINDQNKNNTNYKVCTYVFAKLNRVNLILVLICLAWMHCIYSYHEIIVRTSLLWCENKLCLHPALNYTNILCILILTYMGIT